MGKDLKGNYIGKGYRQRPDGRYEARAKIQNESVCLYDMDLYRLKQTFTAKLEEINRKREIITLNDWFDCWFRDCKADQLKGEVSRKTYKTKMKNTYCFILGDKPLKEITQMDIQKATNEIANRGYVQRTIGEAYSILRECFEVAVANDLVKCSPCVGIKIRDANIYAERRVMTIPEQERFLSYAFNTMYYEVYQFLLVTGVRIGEMSALKWDDVDFENKCIYIKQSLSISYFDGVKHQELNTPKSYSSYRTIPFFEETESILLSWKTKQDMYREKMGERWRLPDELGNLVFTTSVGSPITRYTLAGNINKIVDDINYDELHIALNDGRTPVEFEPLSPHAFRHTFCTRCFEKNMNPHIVQRIMGHANYDTTLSYTHVNDKLLINEAEKVGKFI